MALRINFIHSGIRREVEGVDKTIKNISNHIFLSDQGQVNKLSIGSKSDKVLIKHGLPPFSQHLEQLLLVVKV